MFQFRIAIIGDKQSGKSKFADCLSGERTFHQQDYFDSALKRLKANKKNDADLDGIDILFFDIKYYQFQEYNLYLYCVDLSKLIDTNKIATDIAQFYEQSNTNVPGILVGTKSDQILMNNQEIFENITLADTRSDYKIITSSKNNIGIAELRAFLIRQASLSKQAKKAYPDGYWHIESLLNEKGKQYLDKGMRSLKAIIIEYNAFKKKLFTKNAKYINPLLNNNSMVNKIELTRFCNILDHHLIQIVIKSADICFYCIDLSGTIHQEKIIDDVNLFKQYNTTHLSIMLVGTNADNACADNEEMFQQLGITTACQTIVFAKAKISGINELEPWLIKHAASTFHYTIPQNPVYFNAETRQWTSIDENTPLYLFKIKKFYSKYFIRAISTNINTIHDMPKDVSHYKRIDIAHLLTHRFHVYLFSEARLDTTRYYDKRIKKLVINHEDQSPFQTFIGAKTKLYLIKRNNHFGQPEYFIRKSSSRVESGMLPEGITHYTRINTAYLFTHYDDPFLFPDGCLRTDSLTENDIIHYLHPDDYPLSLEACTAYDYLVVKNQHIYLVIKPNLDGTNEYYLRLVLGDINSASNLPEGAKYYIKITGMCGFFIEQRLSDYFFPNGYLRKEPISRREVIKYILDGECDLPLMLFDYHRVNRSLQKISIFSELDSPRLPGDGYYPSIGEGLAVYRKKSNFFKDISNPRHPFAAELELNDKTALP